MSGSAPVQDEAYAYEARGLLSIRDDHARPGGTPLEQRFVHDALRRLLFHVTSDSGELRAYDYDSRGNPTLNPRVGTLSYTDPARPHAVKSTSDGRTFDYDLASGNQTVRTGPDGRQEIDYTAFDLPQVLREGPHGSPTQVTQFEYDAGGRRTLRSVVGGDQITYVGDLYRQTFVASTGLTQRLAIVALPDGGSVEVDIDQSAVADRYKYQHTDHLGSVVAISDGQGSVVERRDYTPFGKPEQAWSASGRTGYTGHEHDREAGLINMKGRLYDPAIGRFLSADPGGVLTASAQSLNPYSYVLNSPLAMLDPAGFEEGTPTSRDQSTGGNGVSHDPNDIVVIGQRPSNDSPAAADGVRDAYRDIGSGIGFGPDERGGGGAMEATPAQPSGGDPLVELAQGVMAGANATASIIVMELATSALGGPAGKFVVAPVLKVVAPATARVATAALKSAAGAAGAVKASVSKAASSMAAAPKASGGSVGAMKLVSFGQNAASKLRSHSQHIRETARALGVEIPKGPGNPATRAAMEKFITKVAADGNTVTGRYMSIADAQWSRLGDAVVVRQLDGTFITFLDASKGGAALGFPGGL